MTGVQTCALPISRSRLFGARAGIAVGAGRATVSRGGSKRAVPTIADQAISSDLLDPRIDQCRVARATGRTSVVSSASAISTVVSTRFAPAPAPVMVVGPRLPTSAGRATGARPSVG